MKKFVLAGVLILLSAWVLGQSQYKKMDGYLIKGTIEGNYKSDKVYLVEEDGIRGKARIIDSTKVVDNQYTFQGPNVGCVKMYFIKSADTNCVSPLTPFFLENGEIKIRANADFFLNSKISGTPNNDIFNFYNFLANYVLDSVQIATWLEHKIYGNQSYEIENQKFKERSAASERRNTEIGIKLIEMFPDQVFAPFVAYWSLRSRLPIEQLKALRAKMDASLNNHPYMKQLDEFIQVAAFGEGSEMINFVLPDQKGKKISLKDFRGKYVLVDFWASWCGPCIRELPYVAKLYKECKGKNFEIIGVSLDSDKEAWLGAIKKNNMKWVQVCDLKGWRTMPAKACNVAAIPYTVLIDPEGKVIALNLRGEELLNKVKSILDIK